MKPILHGRQLGDYSPNQVASSKILGAMATKMVATWRVVLLLHPSLKHNTTADWGQNVEAVQKDTLSVTLIMNWGMN